MAALASLTVAAAALRFATLDLQSFWVDEGATVQLLRRDLGGLLDGIPITEKTPPLYYVLAWLWTRPFGTGEVGVRSLSALAGVLTVPAVFALARELASERAGLIAAALVAVNPFLVWYSQEARAYALLALFATLAALFCVRTVGPRAAGRHVLWWAVFAALALATHYAALFVVAPLAVWLVLRHRARPRALAAVAAVAAASLALVPLAVDQSENPGTNFIEGTSLGTRLAQVPKQLLLGYDAPLELAFTIAAVALAAAGALLALRAEPRRGALVAVGLSAAAIGVPLLAAAVGPDYVLSRNLIFGLVPLAVLLGAGFAARGRAGLLLAGALAALSLATVLTVFARPEFQRDDWRGVAEALGPPRGIRALVVNPIAGQIPLSLYVDGLEPWGEGFHPVDEVAVVAVATRRPGELPRPPRHAQYELPGEIEPVGRTETDTFTLLRLRAVGEREIAPEGLVLLKLDTRHAAATLRQRRQP